MILRFCICIPTYNNPKTIAHVVSDCLSHSKLPILIIDDGSDIPVDKLIEKEERITVYRFEKNQGKGIALQKAFRLSIEKGYTHLLTLDGDGQHLPSEISKLIHLSLKYPFSLIIGKRNFDLKDTPHVPGVSQFGRKFSNFWVKYETDTLISDSQSGLRVYPLYFVQGLKFFSSRFDFEIEVLIRLLWKNVQVREVDVEVFYPEAQDRVSHFHKFWDNVKISLLNIMLVALSLMKLHKSPKKTALGIGLGVFIGSTPFFGLHAPIAAVVSVIFRLNFLYLFIGTQVSIPPLMPFLMSGSLFISSYIFGLPMDELKEFFWAWLFGSLILGAVLGSVIGGGAYFLSGNFLTRKNKKAWSGTTRGGRIGNSLLKWILLSVGRRPAYFVLMFLVPYFYLFAPRARRGLDQYWKIAHHKNFIKRQWLIQKHFYVFGQVLLDRIYQSYFEEPVFTSSTNGLNQITDQLADKKSVLIIGAHIGAWDIVARFLGRYGFTEKLYMVRYMAQGLTVQKVIEDKNMKTYEENESVKNFAYNQKTLPIIQIKEYLEQGSAVGMLGDRVLSHSVEFAMFFDHLVLVDVTPFRIAHATKTKVVYSFSYKDFHSESGSEYYFYAKKDRHQDKEVEKEKIFCFQAQDYMKHCEELLRKEPFQWFNFYEYWSEKFDLNESQLKAKL